MQAIALPTKSKQLYQSAPFPATTSAYSVNTAVLKYINYITLVCDDDADK